LEVKIRASRVTDVKISSLRRRDRCEQRSVRLEVEQGRLVAHHVGAEVHPGSPRVSAELPETGERFEGLIPPIVAAPAFAIRKPAVAIFTLKDYASVGIMTAEQAEILRDASLAPRSCSPEPG